MVPSTLPLTHLAVCPFNGCKHIYTYIYSEWADG